MIESVNIEGLLAGLGTIGIAAVAVTRVLRSDSDWQKLIDNYRVQVDELTEQNRELKVEISTLRGEVDTLRAEVRKLYENE